MVCMEGVCGVCRQALGSQICVCELGGVCRRGGGLTSMQGVCELGGVCRRLAALEDARCVRARLAAR